MNMKRYLYRLNCYKTPGKIYGELKDQLLRKAWRQINKKACGALLCA